ncbi:hypothetical protein TNCV_145621 [Trichonephila clavipes]|nr:hypothetical protein TNCV_145621 [Trichonephila clavipes]
MKASSTFSPGEDSTKITLAGESRLISKTNTPPFLWYSQLMLLAPQKLVFLTGCRQRDTQDWAPGVNDSLCMMAVDCLSGNSFSRHSSKVTSKLMRHCPLMSSCA